MKRHVCSCLVCQRLHERHSAVQMGIFHRRRAAGLCPSCGRTFDEATRLCAKCQKRRLKAQRARYLRRYKAGLCVICGRAKRIEGQTMCVADANEVRDRVRLQKIRRQMLARERV